MIHLVMTTSQSLIMKFLTLATVFITAAIAQTIDIEGVPYGVGCEGKYLSTYLLTHSSAFSPSYEYSRLLTST